MLQANASFAGSRSSAPPWALQGDALRERVAQVLEEARARTLALLAPLPDAVLAAQHSPLVSPLSWDLAHVVNQEEQWLLGALGAGRMMPAEVDALYDAVSHPRETRGGFPLLTPQEAWAYAAKTRAGVLAHLCRVSFGGDDPLLHAAFVYGMVAQHEHQHAETLLAALQWMTAHPRGPLELPRPPGRTLQLREVRVPGGPFVMGTDDDPWAYDNERPAHVVDVPPFFIDTVPVSNGDFLRFIEDGGYVRQELWAPEGWALVEREGLRAPLYWTRRGDGTYERRRFGTVEALPLDEPVQHVSWFEADAFARWVGKRLPTEAEWEKAAVWDPARGKRRHPWGDEGPNAQRANLWQGHWAPCAAGSMPAGASPCGAEQLLGDVWEWTASPFAPYPGFRAFPYRQCSEAFFGGPSKVLRGGAWATHPLVARATFRNWDLPDQRQRFAGFRCARDDS